MTDYHEILRSKGIKVTKQRLIILETLASSPYKHFSAEEIYDVVKADCPAIGLATVYRTIQLLSELHLIDRVNLDDGYVRYEIATDGTNQKHHHHHLICRGCGKVFTFRDDLLESLENEIKEITGFHVIDHEVKLYGYCAECGGKLIEEKRK